MDLDLALISCMSIPEIFEHSPWINSKVSSSIYPKPYTFFS